MFEEKCNLSIETTENVMEFSSDYDQITTSERLEWRKLKLSAQILILILVLVKYCSCVLILYRLTILHRNNSDITALCLININNRVIIDDRISDFPS